MTLHEAIERLQALCRKRDARALEAGMFAPDATLCGEGAPGITSGAALLPALAGMLEITPELSIRAVRVVELAEGAAVTWLEWSSPTANPGETLAFRSLTAWRKRGEAWVIAADMYGLGTFGA